MKKFILTVFGLLALAYVADANPPIAVGRSFGAGRSFHTQRAFTSYAFAYPSSAIYAPAALYAPSLAYAPCAQQVVQQVQQVQQQIVPPAVPLADTSCQQTAQLFQSPSYAPSLAYAPSYAPAISYAPAYSADVGYGIGTGFAVNRIFVRSPIHHHHKGTVAGTTVVSQRGLFGRGSTAVVANQQRGIFRR